MNDHLAIVLAAGGSRRLGGRAKQLLLRDGETLVRRAVRLAQATAPRRLLLVVGAHAVAVADAAQAPDVQPVINLAWHEGLASSVRAARDALLQGDAGATRCLLLACDQPALEVQHLQALLDAAAAATSGCAGTLHGDRLGIPAVVTLSRLLAAQPQGDAGLRELLNAVPPDQVGRLDLPELAFDLDTPQDLDAAIQHGWIDAQQE